MPAPANDNFASASALSTTLPGSLTGLTTFDATEESPTEPRIVAGGSSIEQSIWFTFTPTSTGTYVFRIPQSSLAYHGRTNASDGEVNIMVFNASGVSLATCSLANLMGAYDSGYTDPFWSDPHDPTQTYILTSGVTYYIKICSSFGAAPLNRSTCDFDLEWDAVVAVANDDFADAEVITGESGSVLADNNGATAEGSEPNPNYQFAATRSVWYSWTAPSDGRYRFQAGDADNDTLLAVWTGASLGSLVSVVRNDDGGVADQVSVVGFVAVAGTTYMIQVDSRNSSSADLIWEKLADAEGFDQASAIEISPGTRTSGTFDNLGHTEPAPADADARFAAFSGYTGGDTYHFGATKWFVVPAVSYPVNLEVRATDALGFSEYGMFVYDENLDPMETVDGFDAVAISDYDDGIRVPVSSTNFSASDVSNKLTVHVPAGTSVYLVVAGFVVEERAI